MKKNSPTIAEAVEQALVKVDGPIKLNAFIEKVLEIRPSSAKKASASASIRNHLRMDEEGKSLVYLDKETIIPLQVGIHGVRFRIPLSRWQVNKGVLMVWPFFLVWASSTDNPQSFELVDEQDGLLPTNIVSLRYPITRIGEDVEVEAFELNNWFQKNNPRRNDSILVTIKSWKPKGFRLEFEPEKERHKHRDQIKYKNQELADILFNMLETAGNEKIFIHKAIPTAYLRLSNPKGYPGDQWTKVLEEDCRMRWSDFYITYPENLNLMERMLNEGRSPFDEKGFTPEQEEQVYRFKAALKYQKNIWRRIEIQGEQTLAEFDNILRHSFGHDPSDHLGGFWKLVRRGQTRRFRKIDLGSINPLGEGSGANIRIAGLNLQVGDRITYVYDFGDWIEHEITLEEIELAS